MAGRRRKILGAAGGVLAVLAVLIAAGLFRSARVSLLTGAVLAGDVDPRDQLPISGVRIAARSGISKGFATSDSSGGFQLQLKPSVGLGRMIALDLSQPKYQPAHLELPAASRILIVRLTPLQEEPSHRISGPLTPVANVRVRYATRIVETENVGSAVKTFEVVNTGNVPCNGRRPCSPDGKWKAAIGGVSLDAGEGNVFDNVRVSCIAGPCPFTAIAQDHFSEGGRRIGVSVRNWSDTATYLLEAEVFRTMANDAVRTLFPVIFGRALSFTLPGESQGLSIEAEINGSDIVFPMGPDLLLSWAECSVKAAPADTNAYRCELKPGYQFR